MTEPDGAFDFDDPAGEHVGAGVACFACGASLAGLAEHEVCPSCRTPVALTLERDRLAAEGAELTDSYPCLGCGYDLRGLRAEHPCPECGKPIAESLRSQIMRHRPLDYVQRLRTGSIIVLVLTCIAIFVGCIGGALGFGGGALTMSVDPIELLTSGLSFVGWWLLTTPAPGEAELRVRARARKVVRASLVISLSCTLLGVTLAALGAAGLIASASPGLSVLAVLLGGGAPIAGIVTTLAGMIYLRGVALSLGSRKLAGRARFVLIMNIVLLVLGVALGVVAFAMAATALTGAGVGLGIGMLVVVIPFGVVALITYIATIVLFAGLTGALGKVVREIRKRDRSVEPA